uniref:Nudix hydrolase 8 n=2 Tax=Cacopsylla melanoneura TaxID=428564 RepID=A0A8D9EFQ7_9HEMI
MHLCNKFIVESLSPVKVISYVVLILFQLYSCSFQLSSALKCSPIFLNFTTTLKSAEKIFNTTQQSRAMSLFTGKRDNYNGVAVDLSQEPFEDFQQQLEKSLINWKADNVRGVWFNVSLSQADVIPVLTKHGFRFHHASKDGSTLIMTKWLPEDQESRIPGYAHTMIGAGAVVLNEKNQVLVVKEFYRSRPQWKLPGGYVELSEDIGEAAKREVLEETNIRTEFHSLAAFRHTHKAAFGCSDIYFIVRLKPLTEDITNDDREIAESKWMDVDEFLNHPEVHENNRMFVRQCVENPTEISGFSSIHPVLKHPQFMYFPALKNNTTSS